MKTELNRSPEEAVSLVPDTIRFTFEYPEARYTQGVWADIGRLEEQGFEQNTRKNYWSDDQYKGINSQWIESDSGQRFEVQFHTRISFEAKQLTHDAYENSPKQEGGQVRGACTGCLPEERSALRYQFRPEPSTFQTTRREAQMPDKVTYYAVVNELSSRERPGGLFRRTYFETGGRRDEAFTQNSCGRAVPSLVSAERGDLREQVHRDHRGRGEPAHGATPRPVDRRQRLIAPCDAARGLCRVA